LPNHRTRCEIKAFRIDTENQEGIVFKDETLYKAIKEKYEYALKIKTKDFTHENYDEWSDIKFISGSENEWTFDNDNLIIVANKKDLREIKSITVSTMHISDLTGIEKFVAAETLSFENNMIIDISEIIKLDENKKKTTEEFKQKFDAYVAKLATLVGEYNSLKSQIEAIDKEIEDLRKAIANGQEVTDKETTEEKEARKEKLEISQEKKLIKIKEIIAKIEEISNVDETEGMSSLLTSPSIRNGIEEIIKEINVSNNNVLEQKEIIENNKLIDIANRINAILDNLTEKEILKLVDEDLNGKPVISNEQLSKAEAKYAIEHMKKHIDQTLDNRVDDLIDDINDLTGSEITALNNEGKAKDASTLRNELKNALNRYYDSKNGITAEDVVDACMDMTGIGESELLIEVKDSIIPIIKENIVSYASDVSEEIIEDLRANIKDYIFDLDTMKKENEVIINDKLIPAYAELYEILDTLQDVLKIKDYLNDPDDISRIIRRLQSVTDEDINEVIKLTDLTTVDLERNLINDADKLSEIETLKVLNLSYNYISNFSFDKFQKIEQLYLGNNSIKDPEITGMENIKTLELTNNWIDTISKINLSGMPKLSRLDLSYNRITDIEYLINSKNEYIESLGYENVGEYWQDGNIEIAIGGQTFGMISENRSDLTDIEIGLPEIFAQMKALETPNFRVTFECTEPLYNVSQDGTKLKVDAEYIYDTRMYGYVYMNAGMMERFGLTVAVFYEDDKVEPTISEVAGVSETFSNADVILKIEGATDEVAGLHERPYSFDGGTTWQASNAKTFTENTENIVIKVRDAEGNIYTHEPISITNIDKTAPVITISDEELDAKTGKSSVTITITEEQSGLNDENKYEYCLSTSKEEANGTWVEFVSGTAFEVGEGLEGTYYMFVREVSDKVGNVSEAIVPVEFTFVIPDTTNPTITGVTGNPENWTNKDVTLKIESAIDETALDDEPYSFDGGNSWQASNTKTYTQNTENIEILVRDAAGNVYTHEIVNITKIDKTAPTVNVNVETTEDGKAKVTVTASDAESGLNEANEYEYYVSTSKDELTGGVWTEYKSGETFEIGEELEDGTYYVTIKNVKDNANNETVIAPVELKLETKLDTEVENKPLVYLTFEGITSIISAYINDDFSSLSEDLLVAAGPDKEFSFDEVAGLISLYVSTL